MKKYIERQTSPQIFLPLCTIVECKLWTIVGFTIQIETAFSDIGVFVSTEFFAFARHATNTHIRDTRKESEKNVIFNIFESSVPSLCLNILILCFGPIGLEPSKQNSIFIHVLTRSFHDQLIISVSLSSLLHHTKATGYN